MRCDPVFGAWFTLNGNGEMTGTAWLEESGLLEGPIVITNTHSVGVVRDAVIALAGRAGPPTPAATGGRCRSSPRPGTAAERHQRLPRRRRSTSLARSTRHAAGRWPRATSAAARAWSATSSRAASARPRAASRRRGGYTVGVLVQCNYGTRETLRIAGVPVGPSDAAPSTRRRASRSDERARSSSWSATDAPLLPHQLKRSRGAPRSASGAWAASRERVGRLLRCVLDGECGGALGRGARAVDVPGQWRASTRSSSRRSKPPRRRSSTRSSRRATCTATAARSCRRCRTPSSCGCCRSTAARFRRGA